MIRLLLIVALASVGCVAASSSSGMPAVANAFCSYLERCWPYFDASYGTLDHCEDVMPASLHEPEKPTTCAADFDGLACTPEIVIPTTCYPYNFSPPGGGVITDPAG